MQLSRIALVALACVVLQADCCQITRLSVGPYYQTGYIDGPLPTSCGCTRKFYILPGKTSLGSSSLSGCLPSKGLPCPPVHHLPQPSCFEQYCTTPAAPHARLASCTTRLPACPAPRSPLVSYSGGSCFCDDCW